MTPKRAFLLIAATLGIAASIVVLVPNLGPLGIALQGGGRVIEQVGNSMLDDCPRSVCACDAKGDCAIHGPVGFPDGGATCRCP